MSDIRELHTLWGIDIDSIGERPQYFELRTWRGEAESGYGICIRGLVKQIKLLETNWS